ncbi:hypothetical protein [Streptomyces microflavus]|uniref:hypothetical protein n=1 Tax=Streptomyces microflavus TaxID=1919 RepID=UPI0036974676
MRAQGLIAGALLPGPDVYRSLLQYGLHVPGQGGYAALAFASTAAIGVGTVLGNQSGGSVHSAAGHRPRRRRTLW